MQPITPPSEPALAAPSGSLWKLARKRFWKNKPAVAGLLYVGLSLVTALCAYVLAPDDTRNANFQLRAAAAMAPGTQVTVLLQPSGAQVADRSWLSEALSGRDDLSLPICLDGPDAWALRHDTLRYTELGGRQQMVLLPVFLLRPSITDARSLKWMESGGKPYQLQGDRLQWIDESGALRDTSMQSLASSVASAQVKQHRFVLGSDGAGRDVLSRLLVGARVSLAVGFMAVLVSLALGLTLGSIAGLFRGRVDAVVMWLVSVVWSIPTLLLAIAISFALGQGFWQLFVAIGVSMWVDVARMVRGQIFTLRETQFIEAARVLGYRPPRIILKHLLPNVAGPVLIVAASNFATAILLEAGLSFLGVGVKPPTPSWGGMILEGYNQVMFDSGKWLVLFPGLAMVLLVVSVNLVSFGLRDALDPRHQASV